MDWPKISGAKSAPRRLRQCPSDFLHLTRHLCINVHLLNDIYLNNFQSLPLLLQPHPVLLHHSTSNRQLSIENPSHRSPNMPAPVHAPTSRTREKITGDEEAAKELKLGEFQNVPTLTLSEARLLINAVMDHRKSQRKVEETE